jgi:hypothetical protein
MKYDRRPGYRVPVGEKCYPIRKNAGKPAARLMAVVDSSIRPAHHPPGTKQDRAQMDVGKWMSGLG